MANTTKGLDVREIPPQQKHTTILKTYEALEIDHSFTIINDHDPKPLRYQMMGLYGKDALIWEYLQEGPKVWKVRIGKMG